MPQAEWHYDHSMGPNRLSMALIQDLPVVKKEKKNLRLQNVFFHTT